MLKKTLKKLWGFEYTYVVKQQSFNLLCTFSKTHIRKVSLSAYMHDKTTKDKLDQASFNNLRKEIKENFQPDAPYVIEKKDQEIVNDLKKGNIFHPYKDPWERARKILLEDIKIGARKCIHFTTGLQLGSLEPEFFPRHTDIVIIGSNAIGVMIAYEIKKNFPFGPNVIVVDRDNNFPHLSTNLGQGILLQQICTEDEEFQMSQYCAEFLSSYNRQTEVQGHPEFRVPYEPMGGLFLADKSNAEKIIQKSEWMKMHKVPHALLEYDSLKNKFPWLNLDGVLFGSLGLANEGLFDPWAFLIGLKCKAVNLGVIFVTAEVIDFGAENDDPRRLVCKLPDGTYNSIDFCYCIIAAGMETLKLTHIINNSGISNVKLKLPIEKRKRYEYCFHNPDGPGLDTPMVIDSDGIYFRREGLSGYYVAGVPSVLNTDSEKNSVYSLFNEKVKPFLIRRIPQCEKYELMNGWADTYDFVTANEVGLIGPHPEIGRLIFANGFAHYGLQYIPAVGRAIMEYIFYDDYQTIDFKKYHIENLYRRHHLEAEKKKKEFIASQHRVALHE